jgi:hypothetical protein
MCRPVTLGVFQYAYTLITVPCGTLLVQTPETCVSHESITALIITARIYHISTW